MNMQVCIPYQKCPFKCPMCIASGRPTFDNVYKSNYAQYTRNLIEYINDYEIDNVVITGTTDPTLDRTWLRKVTDEIKAHEPHLPIEIQTKNYNLKGYNLHNIDVLAYSITSVKDYLKAWQFRKIQRTNRLVILLTKEFDFLTADNFNTFGFDQITFKVLQEGADLDNNKWVQENAMTDLSNIYDFTFTAALASCTVSSACLLFIMRARTISIFTPH